MDDPVLRGRVIAMVLGVIGLGLGWFLISRGSADLADPKSEAHQKIIGNACEAGGFDRKSPAFAKCVKVATERCGEGGGVAKNLSTCARVVASEEF